MACSRRAVSMTITAISCILVLTGFMTYEFMPTVIEAIVKDMLVLSDHSYSYDMWKEVPIPIYLSFYLFNITNHEKVLTNQSEPNLQEVGPFTFLEKRTKENITFHNYNGTVSYQQKRVWHFDKKRSKGSLSDMITHLNIALVGAGYSAQTKFLNQGSEFINYVMNTACEHEGVDCHMYLKHNVSQLLFEGYEDPLIKSVSDLFKLPFDKFGFFIGRNNSATDGVYNIFTGKTDINKLGLMDNWNYEKNLSKYWSRNPCDRMDHSSGGDFQPPYKLTKTNEPIYMFVGDICRSFKFIYHKEVDVKGIKCKRYIADESLFDYSLDENKCFCGSDDGCPANGVANISSCSYDAPMFVSFPHFLYADKSYSKFITGLKPSEDKHQFYMDVEPTLGVPINVNARIQINVLLMKGINFTITKDFAHNQLLVPQLWTSISAEIDDEMSDKLKLLLNKVPLIDDIISFFLMGLGVVLLILFVFIMSVTKRQKFSVNGHQNKNRII